jgi:CheY-like chemotaxis protein
MILVLLADDEPISRRSIARLIVRRGMSVLEASNGTEAIAFLLARPDVDIMITDYTMPRGGVELLRRVHMVRPTLPVILLTGHDVENFAEEGYDLVFGKPVDEQAFFTAIARLTGGG